MVKLIFIGNHFYDESGTSMSSIYTESGERYDWGFVSLSLKRGEEVHIRPATFNELEHYEAMLSQLKRTREKKGT